MNTPDRGERWNPPEVVKLGPNTGRSLQPKDSATLIIVDRSGKQPRVLFGKRNEKQVFMPGKYVFPGGSLDAADRQIKPLDELGEVCMRRLGMGVQKWTPSRGRALALAAIRETAEETGLLVGKKSVDSVTSKAEAWSPFVSKQIRPSLSGLTFVARAITPPKRSRRFDARFFLADRECVGGEIGGIVGPDTELVSLDWLSFDDALDADLPNITKVVVREVADRLKTGEMGRPASFFCFRHGKFWRKELD